MKMVSGMHWRSSQALESSHHFEADCSEHEDYS